MIRLMKTSTEVTSSPYYSYCQKETMSFISISRSLNKMQLKPSKIHLCLTVEHREKGLLFTIITEEVTDPYANQEILSVCLRFVDLSSPLHPRIKECLITFMNFKRANASTTLKKMLESLSDKDICLDPAKIRGLAFDGAAVMASGIAGVQAKIPGCTMNNGEQNAACETEHAHPSYKSKHGSTVHPTN